MNRGASEMLMSELLYEVRRYDRTVLPTAATPTTGRLMVFNAHFKAAFIRRRISDILELAGVGD